MCVETKIKSYILKNKISQIELSRQIGITASKLCLTLNEKRRLTFPEYELICGALDVPVDRFITARKLEC